MSIVQSSLPEMRLPHEATLRCAALDSINEYKPISMDYWVDSFSGACIIGVRKSNKEKTLIKSPEEYTSPIVGIKQSHDEYIIETENTIYIVCKSIPKKAIKEGPAPVAVSGSV